MRQFPGNAWVGGVEALGIDTMPRQQQAVNDGRLAGTVRSEDDRDRLQRNRLQIAKSLEIGNLEAVHVVKPHLVLYDAGN